MIYKPVQEMPVVRDQYQCAFELLEILFKNVDGHDVQIVGRLVHYQQVRLPHKDGQQIEPALLPSREFADLVVQHVVREQELTQEMGVVNGLQDCLILVKPHSALAVVADPQRLSPLDLTGYRPRIRRIHIPDQKIDERGLADTVLADDSDFLIALEIVGEMVKIAIAAVEEAHILAVDDLCSKP